MDVIELTNGAGPDWDWRALAFWTASVGATWRVHLRNGGRCDLLTPRESQPAAEASPSRSWINTDSAVHGSRVLVTDTGTAIRGWLLANVNGFPDPVALRLAGQTYGAEMTWAQAQQAATRDAAHLRQRLLELTSDQLRAVAEQAGDEMLGHELLDRVLRFWDRPRLHGVDWSRTTRAVDVVFVPVTPQKRQWKLSPGDRVMLAGDSFADVHGTVLRAEDARWRVRLRWEDHG